MKKIAVFTSHVYEQMCRMMQKGLIDAALKHGIKLMFFASFGDSYSSKNYREFTKYNEGDKVSFDIPNLDDFDGVIKISTYFSQIIKDHLKTILPQHNIPVINIGGKDEEHFNIRCDDVNTYAKLVEHVIECHGCKDIYHLAGDPGGNHVFATDRLGAYRKVLEEHGIPFDEEKVYCGTMWYDCGEPALDYIISNCKKHGKELPDAVVCVNDYSAIGLINACKSRGIRVPEDLIVTGFDAVVEATSGFPTVTTARQPFYDMGYQAVVTMLSMIEGKKYDEDQLLVGDIFCNQSCGCMAKTVDNVEDFRKIYLKNLENATAIAQSTTNLMISVSDTNTLEECFKAISDNAKADTGFNDMLLCLAPDWDKQRIVGDDFSITDEEMTVVAGFRDGGKTDVPRQTFRKKDILPSDMLEDPNPYYIFAIHHLQYYMGYLIATPETGYRDQKAIQSWFVDLGVILETRRIMIYLEQSVTRLGYLYNRDMLTELYNRRGLEEFFKGYFDECNRNATGLAVIIFDMDDLKVINDSFGHNEGDYGLKTIAYAMLQASEGDEICARSGGDEFVVLAKNYTAEKVDMFIARVREIIKQKVMLDDKSYNVKVSTGSFIEFPGEVSGIDLHEVFEKCLKEADAIMYDEKRRRKVGRDNRKQG